MVAGGFAAGWFLQRGLVAEPPGFHGHASLIPHKNTAQPKAAGIVLTSTGSAQIRELAGALNEADPARLAATARGFLGSSGLHHDHAVWELLLAHWALADGPGMMAFVEKGTAAGDRAWLRPLAWSAWGAADPEAAFAAGKNLPPDLMRPLMGSIAEVDAKKAAAFALRVPDAQFIFGTFASKLADQAPEMIPDLLHRAMYDGARQPLQRAQIGALAKTDPAAAIEAARRAGNIGSDPVPPAVAAAAAYNPVKTAEAVAAMPASRSKALSVVSLAGAWAARDPAAAAEWVRQTQQGPVRHFALVEAAAAAGGADPVAGLRLLEEAGWEEGGTFTDIVGGGIMRPSETFNSTSTIRTAGSLLQQLSLLDAEAARRFLQEKVPDGLRPAIAREGGLEP